MQSPVPKSVSKSVVAIADSLPLDAIPVDLVTDLDLPDVGDAWTDASEYVADSAVVIGKHGGRLVVRTARSAWRNRTTVATLLVVALAIVGVVSLMKRSNDDDVE